MRKKATLFCSEYEKVLRYFTLTFFHWHLAVNECVGLSSTQYYHFHYCRSSELAVSAVTDPIIGYDCTVRAIIVVAACRKTSVSLANHLSHDDDCEICV